MDDIEGIIRKAVDIHYHIGPEPIPRKFDNPAKLGASLAGKLKGIVLKNHFFPTSILAASFDTATGLDIYGSVVLNNYVGGLNPETVLSAASVSSKPIFIWFPTINAGNFLDRSEYEIAPEWVNKPGFKSRPADSVRGIYLLDGSSLSGKTVAVLDAIRETGSILSTGHVSAREAVKLVEKANDMGIGKIVVTHPVYQRIGMGVGEQIYLAGLGAYIEICYSMYSIDRIPIETLSSQIKSIGPEKVILSSDVGQEFSPSPDAALKTFARLLAGSGIKTEWIRRMMVDNPAELIATI